MTEANNNNYKFDNVKLNELYKKLNEKYPEVFNKRQVLSNAIANEIHQALKIKVKEAEEFCKWYQGLYYKKLLIEGKDKVNLRGVAVGKVTKQEEEKAKEYITRKKQERDKNINKPSQTETA